MINEKTMFHGYEFVKGISIDYDLNDDERKELTLAIFSAMNKSLNILEQAKIEKKKKTRIGRQNER